MILLQKDLNNKLEYVTAHKRDFIHIEDLCEALGFYDYAEELKQDRKTEEEDNA